LQISALAAIPSDFAAPARRDLVSPLREAHSCCRTPNDHFHDRGSPLTASDILGATVSFILPLDALGVTDHVLGELDDASLTSAIDPSDPNILGESVRCTARTDPGRRDLGRPQEPDHRGLCCARPKVNVAVRSSGTAEDLADASFAGQHDTYLDVRSEGEVVDAVARCWASLWTARAVKYPGAPRFRASQGRPRGGRAVNGAVGGIQSHVQA